MQADYGVLNWKCIQKRILLLFLYVIIKYSGMWKHTCQIHGDIHFNLISSKCYSRGEFRTSRHHIKCLKIKEAFRQIFTLLLKAIDLENYFNIEKFNIP